jgi:DNA-directed RNA polymerase subunit RPC12/RpoP
VSYAYRCMKCRGRNTLKHELEWYKRTPKCKHCGHFRFYLDKARQYRTDICRCSGYHYTHRTGSKFCEFNSNQELMIRVDRYGEKVEDVLLDMAWEGRGATKVKKDEVPF